MKETVLSLVQSMLNDGDSDSVNSISDSVEAEQAVSVLRDTYYNIVIPKRIGEHEGFFKLVSLSDSASPTHFLTPDNVKNIHEVWYNTSDDTDVEYTKVEFLPPLEFVERSDRYNSSFTAVLDKTGGTTLKVGNDKHPEYYTSFDDDHIVMDSYKSTIDTILRESKSRAYGQKFPVFVTQDDHVPDLDENYFPYLKAEAKATFMSLYKGTVDPKTEQWARRHKGFVQNDIYKTNRETRRRYGRGSSKRGR